MIKIRRKVFETNSSSINSLSLANWKKKCGYCKCDGIMIDKESIGEAAIDHHTLNDYYSISDFVSIMRIKYITFVFNKNVGLKTDCD